MLGTLTRTSLHILPMVKDLNKYQFLQFLILNDHILKILKIGIG